MTALPNIALGGFRTGMAGAKTSAFKQFAGLSVQADLAQIERIFWALGMGASQMRGLVAKAINDTGKGRRGGRRGMRQIIGEKIRERVAIRKRDIDPYIGFSEATAGNLVGVLKISESKRLPLKYFTTRATKSVRYRIGVDEPPKTLPGAFFIDKFDGNVYKRLRQIAPGTKSLRFGPNKSEFPVVKMLGPSPWGVFVKSGMEGDTVIEAGELLCKNLQERLRFALLPKAPGAAGGSGGAIAAG